MGSKKADGASTFCLNRDLNNVGSIGATSLAGLGLIITTRFNVHLSLHIVGISLATLLAVVSWRSYFQDRRLKICLLAFAFLLLDLHQLLELFASIGITYVNASLPLVGIELIHVVSFGTIAFLAAAVLKR
jgi:hypothetical protein